MKMIMSTGKRTCIVAAVCAFGSLNQVGCLPVRGTEFLDAAIPSIQTGVNAILDGLVAGAFAAIEPDANASDNNS